MVLGNYIDVISIIVKISLDGGNVQYLMEHIAIFPNNSGNIVLNEKLKRMKFFPVVVSNQMM